MSTLLCFHAHPDDECIGTGGTIARAAEQGHRVVLVVATNGDHGEIPSDLADGETLMDRRKKETEASAAVLGIDTVLWLGYADSGMTGWEQNSHQNAFMNAPIDEAAEKLAQILRTENVDLLTTYDWHGGYGHPDHIQVHHVGHRAAELATNVRVLEGTMNRDRMRALMDYARKMGAFSTEDEGFDPDGPADDGNPMGTTEDELNLRVDVMAYAAKKREAMACHASQLGDSGFFLKMGEEQFAMAFGTEWFIDPASNEPLRDGWIFE